MEPEKDNTASCLLLPGEVERLGRALFHQQMWCWGYDIRRPEGNLLPGYGFRRQRPPDEVKGSTAYMLCNPSQRSILLWGFGLLYGGNERGHLFLQRHSFLPHLSGPLALPLQVWMLAQMPEFHPPATPEEVPRSWARRW